MPVLRLEKISKRSKRKTRKGLKKTAMSCHLTYLKRRLRSAVQSPLIAALLNLPMKGRR